MLANLTDDELYELHSVIYDHVYYGDDEIVYGDGREAILARKILEKIDIEVKQRKLW